MEELSERTVPADPIELFRTWLGEAESAGIVEPNAMVLATVGEDGQPSARAVLLKGVDELGFIFYTNYESRKGRDLATNPSAAAVFLWTPLRHQVRVEGSIERVSDQESDLYFATRPRESQIGAWASRQSEVIPDREVLERRVAEYERRFAGSEVHRPPYWGGFRIVPERIEFWKGRTGRLHDRLRYVRVTGSWRVERLSP